MRSQDFEFIRDLVKEESGISLTRDKIYLIKTRLEPVLKCENLKSVEELVTQLRWSSTDKLTNAVIGAMTINETFFFRDSAPFDALKNHVIPTLIEERKASRTLNIWCAACSSGQEPYSIAMLLREYFPSLNNWDVSILATDISDEVIEKGQTGIYSQFEIDRGLPRVMLKYFEQQERGWRIKKEISESIYFQKGNLLELWPNNYNYPPMDIVFLRNVLIYFDLDVRRNILQNMKKMLKPDGFLFLGQSETVALLDVPFETCHIGAASCFQPAQAKLTKMP